MKNRLVTKLKEYKTEILNSTHFNDDFIRLVGIELYDFIQENADLKLEFDRRLNYLKNLAANKDFRTLQDNLFNSVQNILKLTSLNEVEEKQKQLGKQAWSNSFKTKKKLDDGTEDIWLTLTEIYEMAKNKNNYYRLGDEEGQSFRLYGEIAMGVHTLPVKRQYEVNIENLFKIIFFNKYHNDKKGQTKFNQLNGKYNQYWYKLDELMYRTPIKLHVYNFEQFLINCAKFHPREGLEFFYSSSFSSTERDKYKFEKIKENSTSIIDDLIEKLEEVDSSEYNDFNKIPICISNKGIFVKNEPTKNYEVRGKRFRIIEKLHGGALRLTELASLNNQQESLISKEITQINSNFKKFLRLKENAPNLIEQSKTSGFFLNKENYDFEIMSD